MAQMTNRRRGEIQRAILEFLREKPDGIRAKTLIEAIGDRLTLSDYEKSDYPKHPGVRRFDKILRFLTIGPVETAAQSSH